MLRAAFLILPAVLRAAWLIKALGAAFNAGPEVSVLSPFDLVLMFGLVIGTAIVVVLGVGAGRRRDSIARVLYDAEHPELKAR
jgi:hypothetical protein